MAKRLSAGVAVEMTLYGPDAAGQIVQETLTLLREMVAKRNTFKVVFRPSQ